MTYMEIDRSTPIRSEQVVDFQPPWRSDFPLTVFVYRCGKGHEVRLRVDTCLSGKTPVPGTGAILCPQCEKED
jgi:hypothetical protein